MCVLHTLTALPKNPYKPPLPAAVFPASVLADMGRPGCTHTPRPSPPIQNKSVCKHPHVSSPCSGDSELVFSLACLLSPVDAAVYCLQVKQSLLPCGV